MDASVLCNPLIIQSQGDAIVLIQPSYMMNIKKIVYVHQHLLTTKLLEYVNVQVGNN